MAKYKIEANGPDVAIELTEVGARQEELLEAFGECQEGRCSCPTNEYSKIEAMEVQPSEDRISIKLRSKPGASLDATEIQACLDYTVARGEG